MPAYHFDASQFPVPDISWMQDFSQGRRVPYTCRECAGSFKRNGEPPCPRCRGTYIELGPPQTSAEEEEELVWTEAQDGGPKPEEEDKKKKKKKDKSKTNSSSSRSSKARN